MKILAMGGLTAALLGMCACTPTQLTSATTYLQNTCRIATAVEAADPAFTSHNGKIVQGQAFVCDAGPALIEAIPVSTASAAPASQ